MAILIFAETELNLRPSRLEEDTVRYLDERRDIVQAAIKALKEEAVES